MMTTREAIGLLAKRLKEELVVGTTGFTCRDLQSFGDRPGNFYMIGSMGLAASMGLGVALCKPRARVVVFDGDGAALMGLGSMPAIAALAPSNLIHVVFDNEVFASTGKQPTYSCSVALDALASAAGYRQVARASSVAELEKEWERLKGGAGPAFLLVKCRPDSGAPAERIRLEPEAITDRFREAVHGA